MHNPVIVALDVPSADVALDLAAKVGSRVGALKIGSELFTVAGPDLVRRIRASGARVFLDLKYHDIPNTVARAVAGAVQLDVQMLTVHTGGGLAMLQAAEQAALETARSVGRQPPLVLGVTVLTSFDDAELAGVGVLGAVSVQVERLARLAVSAGLRGLVCSPLELGLLRAAIPPAVQLVTPGIRFATDAKGDQKRTLSPGEALAAGANWLVVGRPVCGAPDPVAALDRILASLSAGSTLSPS